MNKIFTTLNEYILYLRTKKYIEKNQVYIKFYSNEFNEKTLTEIFEKDNIKLKVKPQEMMKLYSNLIEYSNQMISLSKDESNQIEYNRWVFLNKVYNQFKMFFVALLYLVNKKYQDVYSLTYFIEETLKETMKFYENDDHLTHDNESTKSFEDLKNLSRLIKFVSAKNFVKLEENSKKMQIDDGKDLKKGNTLHFN